MNEKVECNIWREAEERSSVSSFCILVKLEGVSFIVLWVMYRLDNQRELCECMCKLRVNAFDFLHIWSCAWTLKIFLQEGPFVAFQSYSWSELSCYTLSTLVYFFWSGIMYGLRVLGYEVLCISCNHPNPNLPTFTSSLG